MKKKSSLPIVIFAVLFYGFVVWLFFATSTPAQDGISAETGVKILGAVLGAVILVTVFFVGWGR